MLRVDLADLANGEKLYYGRRHGLISAQLRPVYCLDCFLDAVC